MESYGEHRKFRAALSLPAAGRQVGDESVYVEVAGEALLVYTGVTSADRE